MKLLGRSGTAGDTDPGQVRRVTGSPAGSGGSAGLGGPAPVTEPDDDGGATPVPSRLARLASVVDGARRGRSDRDVRKIMQVLGMLAIGFGFVGIVASWYGAAHSPYLYQEIPYVISGGLLGLALVIGGGVLVRCAWSLRQVEEDRRNALAIVRSVDRLERILSTLADPERLTDPHQEEPTP
jgi:hypothetical protein